MTARGQLALMVLVQVLVLSVWFSVSAVLPALRVEWMLGRAGGIWLTATVQIGFVVGAVASAGLNLADRIRPQLLLLAASAGLGAHPAVFVGLLLVWGGAAVADSAQFSAALSEAADPRYVGTALTAQTAIGFLLTVVTIAVLPALADVVGWRLAIPILAVGPLLGAVAMTRLIRTTRAVPGTSSGRRARETGKGLRPR